MSASYGKKIVPYRHVLIELVLIILGTFLVSCSSIFIIPNTGNINIYATIPPTKAGTIPVIVKDENGEPFSDGVVVHLGESTYEKKLDNKDIKILPCTPDTPFITAWHDGYYIAFQACDNRPSYEITLLPLTGIDNSNYQWLTAKNDCINCHSQRADGSHNEYGEWIKSGHAKVFDNRFFETMYLGTNLNGQSSPTTVWTLVNDRLVRVAAEKNADYHGPGYILDSPNKPGNCAYCHVPTAVPSSQASVDLKSIFPNPGGVAGEGVTCDVCHKVLSVDLANDGLPFTDRPGVLSFEYLRPTNTTFSMGPISSADVQTINQPGHSLTCDPIFNKSEFCAACHYGKFGNTVIYDSYGEWRESIYGNNPEDAAYKTCQDCHMLHIPADDRTPVKDRPQACSENDTSLKALDHTMMNIGQYQDSQGEIPRMIKNAASINVVFKYEPDKKDSLDVIVTVENTQVGHKFPTDSPLRHLILVIDAKDQRGTSLMQVEGDKIPNWGGVGKPYMDAIGVRNYGGLPGKIFANLLSEDDTNISPTAAYWNSTSLAWVNVKDKKDSDTRLKPKQEDPSTYSFSVPHAGEVKVTVTLIYRYAFFDLMDEKGWKRPDIIVTSIECEGKPTKPDAMKCKTIQP